VNDKIDWDKLSDFIYEHKDLGKLSVSGGGDCLYRYDRHVSFWIKLFELCKHHKMKIDVHTREKFTHTRFWKKINKCVFSSDNLEDDIEYLKYLNNFTKIRITHLVTAETTDKMIEDYLEFQKQTGCQFTIKQLIKHDDCGRYVDIRKKHPNIYNLDAGDYNIYYMPDNSIRTKFLP
jgi:hypothetical protein